MIHSITSLTFSPTHSSSMVAGLVSARLGEKLGCACTAVDFTRPPDREQTMNLQGDELLVLAFPVYAGRIPHVFAKALQANVRGNRGPAVAIAVYGNRDFDDALVEAEDLLASQDFALVAAIAAIAQHTFAPNIGAGRPDAEDKAKLLDFADSIAKKLQDGNMTCPRLPGNRPYRVPKPSPAISPLTSDACNYCGICARDCPVGVIDSGDEHIIAPGCIRCTACVKYCPQKAKSLPEEFLAAIRTMLASKATGRKEPELFI